MNTINIRAFVNKEKDINYPLWHPYSNINKNINHMLNIVRGEGVYLYDTNGKRYLDAASGLWNVTLGYGNEAINSSIIEQLDTLSYCSLFENTNPTAVLAAKTIKNMLPEYFKKIFFTCSGSESVELAIKLMREYWFHMGKKDKNIIISLADSYHGTYYGSMSVSGIEREHLNGFVPLVGDIEFFKPGVCNKCKENSEYPNCKLDCLRAMEAFIRNNEERIAGIVLEPLLASKGVTILSEKYIKSVQELCNQYNILLAVDEVAVGFYRTGSAFYFQRFNLKPDMVCMAKGINSGYLPLGAVAICDDICNLYMGGDEALIHGSTQAGNLLACAASIATLKQYTEMNISENVLSNGKYLIDQLRSRILRQKNVGDIRGQGLIIGIDLVKDKTCKTSLEVEKIVMIKEYLKRRGLITYMSDTGITLLPMLIVEKSHVDFIVEVIEEIFNTVVY